MNFGKTAFSQNAPWWEDVADLLEGLPESPDERLRKLNALAAGKASNAHGQPIQFISSLEIPGVSYEEHIFQTGQVSTRDNWHDLFNALAWICYPKIKSAMNALHFSRLVKSNETGRGRLRDALTLFDECGVIVASESFDYLQSIAERSWPQVFNSGKTDETLCRVYVCGHAMLEKFLQPYKSMTANALLIRVPGSSYRLDRSLLRELIDLQVSGSLLEGGMFATSKDLAPLPLSGLPGWWQSGPQNEDFYADRGVFRPPPAGLVPSPVFSLD